jgi:hypothetical protein
MPILGIIASAIRKLVLDTFTRTTAGSLGTTTSGAPWTAIRGTWFSNGSAAQSDGTASDYPIATVSMGPNVKLSATVSQGTGLAFWVTDSGSWWASTAYATQDSTCTNGNCSGSESYSCTTYPSNCNSGACSGSESYNYYTYPSTCNNGACSGTETRYTNVSTCNNGSCGGTESFTNTRTCRCTNDVYPGWGTTPQARSNCLGAGGTYSTTSAGTCTFLVSNCSLGQCSGTESFTDTRSCSCSSQSYQFSCSCPQTLNSGTRNCSCPATASTCSRSCSCSQNYYLRLIKSVGGVVSTATSDVSLNSAAAAIALSTAGAGITATAYSDTALTTSLGTLSYTATSPVTGPNVGVIKAPSGYNQGSTVDDFTAKV